MAQLREERQLLDDPLLAALPNRNSGCASLRIEATPAAGTPAV